MKCTLLGLFVVLAVYSVAEELEMGRRGGGGFLSTTGSFTLASNRGGNSEAFLGDIAEEDVGSNADLSELVIPRDVDESEAHEIVNKAYAKKPEGKTLQKQKAFLPTSLDNAGELGASFQQGLEEKAKKQDAKKNTKNGAAVKESSCDCTPTDWTKHKNDSRFHGWKAAGDTPGNRKEFHSSSNYLSKIKEYYKTMMSTTYRQSQQCVGSKEEFCESYPSLTYKPHDLEEGGRFDEAYKAVYNCCGIFAQERNKFWYCPNAKDTCDARRVFDSQSQYTVLNQCSESCPEQSLRGNRRLLGRGAKTGKTRKCSGYLSRKTDTGPAWPFSRIKRSCKPTPNPKRTYASITKKYWPKRCFKAKRSERARHQLTTNRQLLGRGSKQGPNKHADCRVTLTKLRHIGAPLRRCVCPTCHSSQKFNGREVCNFMGQLLIQAVKAETEFKMFERAAALKAHC